MDTGAAFWRYWQSSKRHIERWFLRGNDGITQRGGGDTGPNSWPVCRHNDGLGEVEEGVK